MLCMDGDEPGISTMPTASGSQGSIHAASIQPFSIDTLIVPAYSSRPGASKQIFLDFNGRSAVDNWGGWWEFGGKTAGPTPAYDIDGDNNSFSDLELAKIQKIWKGVAEKFSPFDVNVTTVQPSTLHGVEVVIGGDGAWYGSGGGVALVGGFDQNGTFDENGGDVAFVWDSPANTVYTAEAVAHEAGHTLGLNHISLPPIQNNEYAPGFIMGAGDGGIGRWTKTSVSGTTSSSRDGNTVNDEGPQDDLATIVGNNGFGYRPDDYGNTTGTATTLTLSSVDGALQANAAGVIEQNADQDVFRIVHNGASFDAEVLAAEFRGMLDPQLVLTNSSGTVIASSSVNNGSDGVGERISFNSLNSGTYFLTVKGSGNYGDIGQYRLNVRAGTSTTASNDTLGTATTLGLFGQTDQTSLQTGFAGTAVINDSVTTADTYDYFRFVAPTNTSKAFFQLSGLTTSASIAVYDDLNGNGIVESGEIVFATNPGTGVQSFTYNNAVGGKQYYVRVMRGSSAPSGNYQLRITTDAAPATLPPSTPVATYDPAPLEGGKIAYDSIDNAMGDTTDYFRVTAEKAGLFTFYMFPDVDLRLDVGTDTNGNGVLDAGEILASSTNTGSSTEYIQNLAVTANQKLLVRITQQTAGVSGNYYIQSIADYATGGNTTGVLTGAEDLTGQSAGSVYEYFDASVDFYDTFKIAPQIGQMQAEIYDLDLGANHLLQIVRDGNNNGVVDSGEVVASGPVRQVLSYNVIAGGTYYLRVQAQFAGEFYSTGNYRLVYNTAGSVGGSTIGAPSNITPTTMPSILGGYLGYDPTQPMLTNAEDYYQFTVSQRTRFDVSINGPGEGVQVGYLDGQRNFQRLGGIGTNQGIQTALSVNLNPGTYMVRAYLPVAERQTTPSGGNYGLTFKIGSVTDNSPPVVTASSFQYEIDPVGVSFTMDQDVAGSIDNSDVTIKNVADNTTYPIGSTFYDSTTHRIGYGVASKVLPDGNYRATLLAGSLRDNSANPNAFDTTLDFFALAGDANHDRKVDVTDLGILATNWQGTGKTFSQGDFNYDGVVDVTDLGILATNWQKVLAAPAGFGTPVKSPDAGSATNSVFARTAMPVAAESTMRRSDRTGLVEDVLA